MDFELDWLQVLLFRDVVLVQSSFILLSSPALDSVASCTKGREHLKDTLGEFFYNRYQNDKMNHDIQLSLKNTFCFCDLCLKNSY